MEDKIIEGQEYIGGQDNGRTKIIGGQDYRRKDTIKDKTTEKQETERRQMTGGQGTYHKPKMKGGQKYMVTARPRDGQGD